MLNNISIIFTIILIRKQEHKKRTQETIGLTPYFILSNRLDDE